ncbi:hypothetical protein JMJ78_0000890, partial [Colletotrichum scovillei]
MTKSSARSMPHTKQRRRFDVGTIGGIHVINR